MEVSAEKISSQKLNNLDVVDTISKGFELFKKSPLKLAGVNLIGMFLVACTFGVLSGLVMLNLFEIAHRLRRAEPNTYEPKVSELFTNWGRTLPGLGITAVFFLIAFVILKIIMTLGLLPLWVISIVLGTVFYPAAGLSLQLYLDHANEGVISSLKTAFNAIFAAPKNALLYGAVLALIGVIPNILNLPLISFILTLFITPYILMTQTEFYSRVKV